MDLLQFLYSGFFGLLAKEFQALLEGTLVGDSQPTNVLANLAGNVVWRHVLDRSQNDRWYDMSTTCLTCRADVSPTLHDVAKGKGCRMSWRWRFHDMSMTCHLYKWNELSQMVSKLWHHTYISIETNPYPSSDLARYLYSTHLLDRGNTVDTYHTAQVRQHHQRNIIQSLNNDNQDIVENIRPTQNMEKGDRRWKTIKRIKMKHVKIDIVPLNILQ